MTVANQIDQERQEFPIGPTVPLAHLLKAYSEVQQRDWFIGDGIANQTEHLVVALRCRLLLGLWEEWGPESRSGHRPWPTSACLVSLWATCTSGRVGSWRSPSFKFQQDRESHFPWTEEMAAPDTVAHLSESRFCREIIARTGFS